MAERTRRRSSRLSRNPSTESAEESSSGPKGKSIKEKRHKKPKERWLLTRKTWRYMADAGRKLIPEGVSNRPEDIPKIEAYFQEVCKREPHFLLWRKNSYPGALGFRPNRKRKDRRKGGSCRKASSADEIEQLKPERPKDLAIRPTTSGRFDLQKMKYDFLNQPYSPANSPSESQFKSTPYSTVSAPTPQTEETEENQLIDMLEKYLRISSRERQTSASGSSTDLNYQELVNKLQRHLLEASKTAPQPYVPHRRQQVHFEGDHFQKSLAETLSRYFSQYPNRDKVISDLLTDRKALEKLYFELRQAKGFRGGRGGAYSGQTGAPWSSSQLRSLRDWKDKPRNSRGSFSAPPPLIEIQGESLEPTYEEWGIQTDRIPEEVLVQIEEEYKKALAEKEEEARDFRPAGHRRRSSVDNDDVSQSVSDTIKRYLRMARKKSVDGNKNDRFKRVNYDRNLRNIKAKGEITKPGDDDGLNKGCQTNDDWIVTFKNSKFYYSSEHPLPSSRNSIDVGILEESDKSPTSPPSGFLSSSQSFLSNLLHGKHSQDKSSPLVASTGGAMQKSKSSSSVMHHGSRLVAKKIFRSRSKSQTRAAPTHSSWTPQGGCVWNSMTGRQVVLGDTTLLQLSDIERKVLQKVALAKLQALNLGINIKIPAETTTGAPQKPKRRAYLLKRKALTTGFFDASRKEGDKDKESSTSSSSGLVFGIPLSQCVDNDRLSSRGSTAGSSLRQRDHSGNETNLGRHGSRASFSSLIDATRDEEIGSCESLMTRERGIMGSVPGLLDSISVGSTADIAAAVTQEDEPAVPHIVTECLRYLETNGLRTVGIFRVSSSKKRVRQLREDFDCGKEACLGDDQCPHDVATLLKEYLRDLPDPLLCRDLYQAFVQTQRIRNRRLQLEALEHLIQLLPAANRDTLWTLLNFLATVARNSENQARLSGEIVPGNKMDSNNLATVFAPNILHCSKPGAKEATERPEDHIDVISVIRTLIDNNKMLFNVPAELLDEVYVHMMDTHPAALDYLLNKRCSLAGDDSYAEDIDSESNSAPLTPTVPTSHMTIEHVIQTDSDGYNTPPEPRKTYSREAFLHESAATGGPNLGMRLRRRDRDRDRVRENATRKKREESTTRRKRDDDGGGGGGGGGSSGISSAINIISRLRGQKEDDSSQCNKLRSSSLDSNSSMANENADVARVLRISEESQGTDRRKSTTYLPDSHGVIKASLTIPVQTGNQPLSLNVDHSDIPYIEDGGVYSYTLEGGQQAPATVTKTPEPPRRRHRSTSGSDSSAASTLQPITGSISLVHSYDSAVGSSATVSSPPLNTTPSSVSSSIPDAGSPPSWASTPPTSPDSAHVSVNYIPDDVQPAKLTTTGRPAQKHISGSSASKDTPTLQKVSFTATPEVQQVRSSKQVDTARNTHTPSIRNVEREQRFTPSITSIGNAVLRSRTADFERIAKTEAKMRTTTSTTTSDKKKYTKRRYTDSKHPTRHIPDSETLEASSNVHNKEEGTNSSSQAAPVYKRRELISSVPSK